MNKLLIVIILIFQTFNIAIAQGSSTDSLQHYLQIQEYAKAVSWLKAVEPENYNKEYLEQYKKRITIVPHNAMLKRKTIPKVTCSWMSACSKT